MKAITIGILPQAQIRARMLSIAKGELKPKSSDPKVWFTSMRSLAEVLSDENRALLKVISDEHPDSIAALALSTGRSPGNLSRTLKTMSNYGLVEMQQVNLRQMRPVAKATELRILAASKLHSWEDRFSRCACKPDVHASRDDVRPLAGGQTSQRQLMPRASRTSGQQESPACAVAPAKLTCACRPDMCERWDDWR